MGKTASTAAVFVSVKVHNWTQQAAAKALAVSQRQISSDVQADDSELEVTSNSDEEQNTPVKKGRGRPRKKHAPAAETSCSKLERFIGITSDL